MCTPWEEVLVEVSLPKKLGTEGWMRLDRVVRSPPSTSRPYRWQRAAFFRGKRTGQSADTPGGPAGPVREKAAAKPPTRVGWENRTGEALSGGSGKERWKRPRAANLP